MHKYKLQMHKYTNTADDEVPERPNVAYFWKWNCSRISKIIFLRVNTDADVCVAVVANVVGVVDQDQDQLADLSVAFFPSSIGVCHIPLYLLLKICP